MPAGIITSTATASVVAPEQMLVVHCKFELQPHRMHACCRSRGNRLMLNSDMCLIKDITFNGGGGGGQPTCTHDSCAASPTESVAQEFAGNNGQFLAEFSAALVKMLNKGYNTDDLTVAGGDGAVASTDDVAGDVGVADVDDMALPAAPTVGAHLNLGCFRVLSCAAAD